MSSSPPPSRPADAFHKACSNPLIDFPDLPNGAPPLDAVKPEHYLPAFEAAIAESRRLVEEIKANRAAPTFENTVAALRFSLIGEKKIIGERYRRVMSVYYNLSVAEAGEAFDKAAGQVEALTTAFTDGVMMDDALFRRIKAVRDGMEAAGLDAERKAAVEETYNLFVRNGALLSDAPGADGSPSPKEQLRRINQKLAGLYAKFRNNAKSASAAWQKQVTDENDLKGVPERVKASYAQNAKAAGLEGWLIKLSPPPVGIFEYADNAVLRKEVFAAFKSRALGGAFDNGGVILEMVRERHKKARLMGQDTFAGYMLGDKVAKDVETVNAFLEKNLATYRPAAEAFLEKVKAFAAEDFRKETGGEIDFQPSDFAYYSRKLKERTFSLDVETEVKPYLRLENVVEGLHKHVKKLFNVDVAAAAQGKYPVYHPDVKAYEVRREGKLLGVFYADYFARDGVKKDGAWMEIFRNRGLDENGADQPAIVINCCNFQKPPEGRPCLLSLGESTTVFHEFGHALHALLAEGECQMVTGYRVKQDVVEVPSQLQENWVWEPEVLATFARNDKGEVLPPAVVKKLRDMDNFDAGFTGLRQTFLGMLDMKWHAADPATLGTVEAVEDEVNARASLFPRMGAMSASFDHLFGSDEYAAGYYGYKWAEALEADIFAAFRQRGLYDPALSKALGGTIYSQGGKAPFMDLFVEMMGRGPDPAALFRREGLAPAEQGQVPPPPKTPMPPASGPV